MNELLNIVIDLNVDCLKELDLATFFGSVLRFLNCFRMQSGMNQSRIYLAFASNSFMIYPLEGFGGTASAQSLQDHSKMHTLSFDTVRQSLLERILSIVGNQQLHVEEEKA